MSEGQFGALWSWLAQGEVTAEPAWRALRSRLVGLFAFWGSASPEEAADETFSRVAARLQGGEVIRTENRMAYLRGVARFVFLEELRLREQDKAVQRQFDRAEERREPDAGEGAACLEKCLLQLDVETRELLRTYYQGEQRERIDRRQQLADRLGIGMAPLRNRVQRLRQKLRGCVEQCLKDTDRSAGTLVKLRA